MNCITVGCGAFLRDVSAAAEAALFFSTMIEQLVAGEEPVDLQRAIKYIDLVSEKDALELHVRTLFLR